jgi:hypothetical protein
MQKIFLCVLLYVYCKTKLLQNKTIQSIPKKITYWEFQYTVESWLSDGTEGRSDNKKWWIIRKTNEKDKGKYQLKFIIQYMILLSYE